MFIIYIYIYIRNLRLLYFLQDIVCFLLFFSVKPFSFIKSIDVWSKKSRQIMKKYHANVFSCKTLPTLSNKSVSPSVEWTITFVFLQIIIIDVIVHLEIPYTSSISSILLLCIDSNSLIVFQQDFFALRSSTVQWIVMIYGIVERFLKKPLWFFVRIFSISGLIRLKSKSLKTLAALVIKAMPLYIEITR